MEAYPLVEDSEEDSMNSMSILPMVLHTQNLTNAIINQDVNHFKHLIQNSSEGWCRTNRFGYTLLQEAIKINNKEIFDYMLQFQDTLDLEAVNMFGKTALMFVLNVDEWNQSSEYYACELINKGAFVHTISGHDTFLHRVITKSVKASKLLLEKGINVNLQDSIQFTALHKVLLRGPHTNDYEFVSLLLCYGADPFIKDFQGYTPFDLSVLHKHGVPVQEILFYYTFDTICCEIQLYLLLQLAKIKSPFFNKILEYNVKIEIAEHPNGWVCDLFLVGVDYLRILLRKCHSVICEVFQTINNYVERGEISGFILAEDWCHCVKSRYTLTSLSLLVENDATLNQHVVNFIGNLDGYFLCRYIFFEIKMDQAAATELLIYMFLHGLICQNTILDLVYKAYGYCELFKFLLHIDIQMLHHFSNSRMSAFIYDINLDFNEFYIPANTPDAFKDGLQLLDYFAHPKLSSYLLNEAQRLNMSIATVRKIQNHPPMPSLVELSRNAFRKYFAQQLKIKSTQQFYTFLNSLPISTVYKKIITFETKLY